MKRETTTALLASRYLLSKMRYGLLSTGKFLFKKNTLVEAICALLVILFIYTGLSKLIDYEKFKFEMGRSPFIQNMSEYIAIMLPPGELLIATSLIVKRTRLIGLYSSFFLMSLFTGYVWIMLHESYYLPCSCGGILSIMSWNDHLLFNIFFTALAMTALMLQSIIN